MPKSKVRKKSKHIQIIKANPVYSTDRRVIEHDVEYMARATREGAKSAEKNRAFRKRLGL